MTSSAFEIIAPYFRTIHNDSSLELPCGSRSCSFLSRISLWSVEPSVQQTNINPAHSKIIGIMILHCPCQKGRHAMRLEIECIIRSSMTCAVSLARPIRFKTRFTTHSSSGKTKRKARINKKRVRISISLLKFNGMTWYFFSFHPQERIRITFELYILTLLQSYRVGVILFYRGNCCGRSSLPCSRKI